MQNWNEILSDRSFWLGYEEWGRPGAKLKEMVQSDPVLRIPFRTGYELWIDCKYLGRGGEKLLLTHFSYPSPLELGWFDCNFALPALRWEEVELLERWLKPRWAHMFFDYKYLPLLLNHWAFFTETDDRERFSRKVWSDWERASLFPLSEIASSWRCKVGQAFPVQQGWKWRLDPAKGWVCEGAYSLRDPENELFEFEALAAFFALLEDDLRSARKRH